MNFSHHEQCPKCEEQGQDRSKNNLGVWDDGSVYCFRCGYGSGGTFRHSRPTKPNRDLRVRLPEVTHNILPDRAIEWLESYGITNEEIEENRFLWCEQYQRLIFPIYDKDKNLLYYQGRSFATDGQKHSKYHTEGQANKIYHVINELHLVEKDAILVVEDLISAIKVGRMCPTMPLWGSNINEDRIKGLSLLTNRLWIWLDKDKAEYSLKTRQKCLPYFDEVRCIITDCDPKCYNNTEIKRILND